MKAAIIGMGVVGRAQAAAFDPVVTYDPVQGRPYPRDEIASCDFAVVCAGTPANPDGSADLRQLRQALTDLPVRLPVLLRSTVPPGTTDALVAEHGGRLICHAPEFLHERAGGAWAQTTDVPWLVLGGTPEARWFFRPHLAGLFPVPHECTALSAELAKYAANLHWAAQVTFVNEMAGICAAHGASWEQVRDAWLQDARVSPDYTAMDGFPAGFGGRCWPKDLSALIAAGAARGYLPRFLCAVQDANHRFSQ